MSETKSVLLDPKDIIGKSENEVCSIIKDKVLYRIAQRDGIDLELTTAFFPFRWNLFIKSGIVVDVKFF